MYRNQILVKLKSFRMFPKHISSSARQLGIGSQQSDNDPEVLEHEKQKTLHHINPTVIQTAPGWNPVLASDAEANV